jgi:peptidyl-prolyl cis-trans isomerase-like 6
MLNYVLVFDRFTELCPQAASNFLKLCEGAKIGDQLLQYKGSPIHRLVKDGWIQCGDLVDGSGANSSAVLDATQLVPDESFTLDFGFPAGGVVGFANSGSHSSGSQFFITMGPCEWMNHNYVGVGRLLQGFSVLRTLNQLATSNQRPVRSITVANCGVTPLV